MVYNLLRVNLMAGKGIHSFGEFFLHCPSVEFMIEIESAISCNLRYARVIRYEDRLAIVHGFQNRHGEPFRDGRETESGTMLEIPIFYFLWNGSCDLDSIFDTPFACFIHYHLRIRFAADKPCNYQFIIVSDQY